MAVTGLDIAETSVFVFDPANKDTLGYVKAFAQRYMLFTEEEDAYWAADRSLREAAFPFAVVVLKTNRSKFRLQPGDLFRFVYADWGVTSMVCRVSTIQEENLGSEEIIVTAKEDADYLSESIISDQVSKPLNLFVRSVTTALGTITDIKMIEAPYFLAGGYAKVMPMAAHVSGDEIGYYLYESVDGGTNYTLLADVGVFNPYGVLNSSYEKTNAIDDRRYVYIDFRTQDYRGISNITRPELFTSKNLALLGDELISFQNIALSGGSVYKISGINRGLYGTEIVEHPVGEEFFFIGDDHRTILSFEDDPSGSARLYKFVPYTRSEVADIDYIDNPYTFTYSGKALAPYKPVNLYANGKPSTSATYTTDVVLTWGSGYRGIGAGLGDPDSVTDDNPSYEGLFKVLVYGHSDLFGRDVNPDFYFYGTDGSSPDTTIWEGQGLGTEITIQSNFLNSSFTGTGSDFSYVSSNKWADPITDLQWWAVDDFAIQMQWGVVTLDASEDATETNNTGFNFELTDKDGNSFSIGRLHTPTGHRLGIWEDGQGWTLISHANNSGFFKLTRTDGVLKAYYWTDGVGYNWDGDTDGFTFTSTTDDDLEVAISFNKQATSGSTTLDINIAHLRFLLGTPTTIHLARTVQGIDALTWTYTEAMNENDNNAKSSFLKFDLSNYRVANNEVTYESDPASVFVRRV